MTLGLIFNHFFPKTHFGAFSVFHTKCGVIFEDKKIQTQKWCIREKFRHQKLGVTKGFFIVKFFSFLISATFWKNDCSATWFLYFQGKNFHLGQLNNHPLSQKHIQSPRGNLLTVFSSSNEECSYLYNKCFIFCFLVLKPAFKIKMSIFSQMHSTLEGYSHPLYFRMLRMNKDRGKGSILMTWVIFVFFALTFISKY